MGKRWKRWETIFLGSKITANGDCRHEIKRCLLLGRKTMTNLDSLLKSRDIALLTKVHIVKTITVVMYGWENWTISKENWVPKNWCFWIVGLERTLESPLDCKEIQPVNPKGNHSWIFIGRTDAEGETPKLWPPDAKNWLIGKDLDAMKGWRQEVKGTTGWDGWMASLTQWTWVWANSRRQWRTGEPSLLQPMGSQRFRHNWATELNSHTEKAMWMLSQRLGWCIYKPRNTKDCQQTCRS